MSLFNKISATNIDLVLANLNLNINNFFGADIGLQINDLSAINTLKLDKQSKLDKISTSPVNGNNIINNIYDI